MTRVVVIGGGPAGAAVATILARAGRQVTLFEREPGPVDKVCGEFISEEAGGLLASLGLDLPGLGAVGIEAVRLCHRSTSAEARLPFAALSLSRRVLDEALLVGAIAAGASVRRGVKVTSVVPSGAGWTVTLDGGAASEEAGAVFLASGKHDLRDQRRPMGWQHDLVAFKMYWRLAPGPMAALARHVEIVLFDGGYAGLQLVEEGRANLCLVVRRARLVELGSRWPSLLAAIRAESAHLDARLDGATACLDRPLALSAIPYGYVRRHADGLWRLGDQAAVIPSFSGDGMSIALHSAGLAAAVYLAGGPAEAYQQRLAHDLTGQVALATLLSEALVRRPSQRALGALARRWPVLLQALAARTRVSEGALARAASPLHP